MPLNQQQRKFMTIKLIEDSAVYIREQLKRLSADMTKYFEYDMKLSMKNGYRWKESDNWQSILFELSYPEATFNSKTCHSLEERADQYARSNTELPRSWYAEQIKAKKNYKLGYEFENCMTQPRPTIKFLNEEKAKKAMYNQHKKNFDKYYKTCADDISEARLLIMDFNKFIKTGTERIMLADNKTAQDVLDALRKEVKNLG